MELAVREALANQPSTEMRRQLEKLLDSLNLPSPAAVAAVRGVEVLELLGTPQAAEVLRLLGGGAAGSFVTREARAALRRLKE